MEKEKRLDLMQMSELMVDGRKYVMMPMEVFNDLLSIADSRPTGLQEASPISLKDIIKNEVCERLRDARKDASLTQRMLAKILNVSPQLISQAENGDLRMGRTFIERFFSACEQHKTNHWRTDVREQQNSFSH